MHHILNNQAQNSQQSCLVSLRLLHCICLISLVGNKDSPLLRQQDNLFFLNYFIYLFIFGCVGSSLLHAGFF